MGFIGKQPAKAAITSSDITDGVVTAAKLASDSVTTAKIADNGVTTAKINADAVTDAKIADDVVGSEHLTAGEVDTTALGADAVTAAKIADDAISDEHLDPTAITGQTAETSAADDDLILLSDTSASAALKKMTRSNFLSGVGGTNTPNFKVKNSGNTSIPNNTLTKLSADTETFDSDNAFASDKFTVPSGQGGKYIFTVRVYWPVNTGSADYAQVALYKNGSLLSDTAHTHSDSNVHNHVSIETVSAGDYFEIYFRQSVGNTQNAQLVEFSGFKLIE